MSETFTFGKMRSKLMAALDRIGNNNGHACPPEGSNSDRVLHEYLVSTDAEAFFAGRRARAKKAMLDMLSPDEVKALEDMINTVAATDMRDMHTVTRGALFQLVCEVKKGSARLDQKKLRNELAVRGVAAAVIDDVFDKSMTKNAPSKTFKVVAAD